MQEPLFLYGIQQCDRCRSALSWCASQGLDVTFIDLRAQPLSLQTLEAWVRTCGADLLNRRSQTYRQLAPLQEECLSGPGLVNLLHAHPLLIKRPVLEIGQSLTVGFKPELHGGLFRR